MKLKRVEAYQNEAGKLYVSRAEAAADELRHAFETLVQLPDEYLTPAVVADQLVSNPALRQQVLALLKELS